MPIGFPPTPTLGQQWPVVDPVWECVKVAPNPRWSSISTGIPVGATPVTDRLTSLVNIDDFIAFRGGVPSLVAASVIAAYAGGSPAATAPAAITAGQWTAAATAVPGQISFDLTALPSDGGSAITALEYRVGAGAAIAFVGLATGVRVVTAGLTAGVAVDLQVRAVNAVGAGAWSDNKNRTPLTSGGAGVATWQSVSESAQGATLSPAAPAGLTATDLQVAVIFGVLSADTYTPPAGWTLAGSIHTAFAGNLGLDVLTAPGTAAQGTWTFSAGVTIEIHRVSGASGVRAIALREAATWATGIDWPDMPSPPATAVLGDAVIASYYGPQNATALGAVPSGYTRVTARVSTNTQGSQVRSNAPAGSTGEVTHGIDGSYEQRATATIILAAA